MKFQLKKSFFSFTVLFILLAGCTSRVGGGSSGGTSNGTTPDNVAFDPTISTNLEVAREKLIRSRLTTIFNLAPSSDAITKLNENIATFRVGKYDSNYAKTYAQIAADACREADTTALFPELTVDYLWKRLTHSETVDPDVKIMEGKMLLKAAGQNTAVKQYSLCLGILLDPGVIFVNFIKKPA